MSTSALTNLWNYIQGMNLTQANKRWLAERLIESENDEEAMNAHDEIHKLAYKICTEQEYQQFVSEGFLENPQPQCPSFTDKELEQHIAQADVDGYLTKERSAQFMDSLLAI